MAISVDQMRRIDHWLGVPLCLLVSPIVAFMDLFRRLISGPVTTPQRILFIELSEMGSAIIADPALREAKAKGAEIFFLIFKSNAKSLNLLNTVAPRNIITIDASGLLPLAWDSLKFLVTARLRRIDTVIDLELFSRYTALLTGLSGAGRRVGFHIFHGEGLWRGSMLSHKVHYNPHQHIAKNFIALVRTAFTEKKEIPFLKEAISDKDVVLAQALVTESALENLRQRISGLALAEGIDFSWSERPGPLLLVNPNASDLLPQRRWGPDRFSALIKRMADTWPGSLILVTGSDNEEGSVAAVCQTAGVKNLINFAGQVSFEELPALYSLADAMVTNDSGPGHFSAVTPLKTVVLFGPETPALYGSLGQSVPVYAGLACSPCVSAINHRKTACTNNVCMQAISVEHVMQTLVQFMGPQALR